MNIKKDFFKGISLFAAKFNVSEAEIQVRLSLKDEEIVYQVCNNWSPKEYTSYNQVMGDKILNLTESIVVPILKQSMVKWARTLDIQFGDFSAFLCKRNDDIVVAIYNNTNNVKVCGIDEMIG